MQARNIPPEQLSPDNNASNFHMQTEEGGDGAQAIESKSDCTDEADASSPPRKYMESPMQSAADTLMF